jgi:hypothetical protein
MNLPPGPRSAAPVLKHPFVLAGIAVVVLLGLTAGVLVLADSIRADDSGEPTVVVSPLESVTAGPVSKTATASGVSGTTRRTVTVRSQPGTRAPALGTLPRDSDVVIDARTTEGDWLRIVFPPNSELHGWVDAEQLNISGDPEELVVATAEPAPFIELPTEPPFVLTAAAFTPEPDSSTVTPVVTGTPAADGLPDLVVGTSPTLADGKLFVTIVNQGTGAMAGDLVVAVFNADGTALVGGATLPGFTLEAGRSIDVGTGYPVTVDQILLLVVDPNGQIDETDNTNNRITVSIAVGVVPSPAADALGTAIAESGTPPG